MKRFLPAITGLLLYTGILNSQTFHEIAVHSSVTAVQPMTGIVLWDDNENDNYLARQDAISLEYSYMKYSDLIKGKNRYDWSKMENVLNDIASRNHQAIIRFYFVYPKDAPYRDGKTTVPDYIKNREGYTEFKGKGDGKECYFPDWRNEELQEFTLDFYTAFAKEYDNDPRLAFLQTGFGLWAEYHTWSGQITADGKTYKEEKMVGIAFPSKEYQQSFLTHLDSTFIHTPWSISIDAADSDYTPIESKPEIKNLNFGLFDDSFMSEEHDDYNKYNWEFFGENRYVKNPAGGEFNYYTDADQKGVLNPVGWRGKTYEQAAKMYHITYMIGNDQPEYRSMDRIKEAGMASGYRFKLERFLVSETSSKVIIKNTGVAPIYYDAYVAVNSIQASQSLKGLKPGEEKEFDVQSGGDNPVLTIECARLLPGQRIQYEGNTASDVISENYPSFEFTLNNKLFLIEENEHFIDRIAIMNMAGQLLKETKGNGIFLNELPTGIYLVSIHSGNITEYKKIVIR